MSGILDPIEEPVVRRDKDAPWLMRTYAGHSSPAESNSLYRRNLAKGQTGLSVAFDLPKVHADDWELNLGDVRESARLRVNGQEVAILWSVPFKVNVGKYLKEGRNLIEVEVTNLPANRIADYDRNKVPWRMFKEINFVKLNYEKGDFSGWSVVPSGLLGPVVLTPLEKINKK